MGDPRVAALRNAITDLLNDHQACAGVGTAAMIEVSAATIGRRAESLEHLLEGIARAQKQLMGAAIVYYLDAGGTFETGAPDAKTQVRN